jgi:hypothetical protein
MRIYTIVSQDGTRLTGDNEQPDAEASAIAAMTDYGYATSHFPAD